MRRSLLNGLDPITTGAGYRVTPEPEEDSRSSSSNSPMRADFEESDFYTGNNDSQSSIGVPTFRDMAVSAEPPIVPAVARLPAEVLLNIFSKLDKPKDLFNSMRVSKKWANNAVDMLWHRPACKCYF